ncbi:MAG: winged helix-turn-helix domain-containing protein [Thermogemmata sp.]
MIENEVNVAFEILLEEIELVVHQLNESVKTAVDAKDYMKAQQTIEEIKKLEDFHGKIQALQKEWRNLAAGRYVTRQGKIRRVTKERLPRGLRTPEHAFRRPILEALVELGGTAPIDKVLERVETKMKDVLNEYDYQPLPSSPSTIRWRNTAQWSRQTMVAEGLLKQDSPYGIWEITAAGRKWLNNESPE